MIHDLPRRAYWSAYLAYHVNGQARYPFRSAARIQRDADRRARRMVAYAYRWAPYYRETLDRLGLTPDDFCTVDDLRQLPLISVADLQAAPERFRSRQFTAEQVTTLHSSGSTGSPHGVAHCLDAILQSAAQSHRELRAMRSVLGEGYRTLSISSSTGSNGVLSAVNRANTLRLRRARAVRNQVDDYASYEELLAALNRVRPDLLSGYGSTLGRLFAWALRTGQSFHVPRALRYAADALAPGMRALLEQEYGVSCFSGYQAIEAFKMGWECEAHTGYHLNIDLYPLRIVDENGHDCPIGVTGEVVISNLVNRGTVLLNYRMGDRAALLAGPCPCGRALPLLSYVQGRTVDVLYDLAGQRHPSSVASAPVRAVAGVLQYQVVQEARGRLRYDLVITAACDRAQATRHLTAAIQEKLGPDMQVEVRFVDDLQLTAGGKLRYVQSLIGGSDETSV